MLAVVAVLAVAFAGAAVVFEAQDADATETAATTYVDATLSEDNAPTYKTLASAITGTSAGGTIILKTDASKDEAAISNINKALTIKSDSTTVRNIPVTITTSAAITLKYVGLTSTSENTVALTVTGTGAVSIEHCGFDVYGGTKSPAVRGDGIISKTTGAVTIENNTFTAGTGGYARAMWIGGAANVAITDNNATGFHVFAATHSIEGTLDVEGNESLNMADSFKNGSETKDQKFLQIAGTNAGAITVEDNDVTDGVPYVNVHDARGATTNAALTVDGDMTITGAAVFNGQTVIGGDITVAKMDTVTATITVGNSAVLVISEGATLTGDSNAKLTNNGKVFNNGTISLSTTGTSYNGSGTFYAATGSKTTASGIESTAAIGGGTVNGKTASGTTTDGATTYLELVEMLASGMTEVKVGAQIVLEGNITVPAGVKLSFNSYNIYIGEYTVTVNGEIAGQDSGFRTGTSNSTAYLVVGSDKSYSGTFTIEASEDGSQILIAAEKLAGEMKYGKGGLCISGKITGDLSVAYKEGTNGGILFEDITVNSGVTLTLGTTNVVVGNGTDKTSFNLYGNLALATGTDSLKIDVKKNATFKAFAGAQIAQKILITGNGTIDLSQAQGTQTIGEDISADKTYGQLEDVVVVGSLTIKNNSKVTIMGGFTVDDGVTLTIEKGSELVIDSKAASMVLEGKIIVNDGAKLTVTNAKNVQVSGAIESVGEVVINSSVSIETDGYILIDENMDGTTYKSTFQATSDLTVKNGGVLLIKSKIGQTTVTNKGSVVLDGAALNGTLTINMAADDATLDIESVKSAEGSKQITITDAGLKFANSDVVGTTEGTTANVVEVTVNGYTFGGMIVAEEVTSYTYDGTTYYTNSFDISGAAAVTFDESTDASAKKALAITGGENVKVSDEFALGKYTGLTISNGVKFTVSGIMIATEASGLIDDQGSITVTGLLQAVSTSVDANANAAVFKTTVGTTSVWNYTTLAAAIEAEATDIQVTGEISVAEDLDIPAGVTVKNGGTITVGSSYSTDVVMTVEDGAAFKNGSVVVLGTLVFENKKNVSGATITSDVSVIGDVSSMYTNVYTALNTAESGDVVTISGESVSLSKDVTIKEGVMLDVPNSKKLVLSAGVTLTVNGILRTAEKVETAKDVAFDVKADKLTSKAAIEVVGVFMSMSDVKYSDYKIPGAYFSLVDSAGNYNYVTTLATASETSATAISVYGTVSAGDVAFTGTSTAPVTLTVTADAKLTASSVTLDKAQLVVADGAAFTGDVVVGDAAVSASLVDDMVVSINTAGNLVVEKVSTDNSKASFKLSAGTVLITEASMAVTVGENATLASSSAGTAISGKLTVEGTVSVANEQTISVSNVVVVKGTLTVAESTDSKQAGTFNVNSNQMYIGLTVKDVTGAAAAVSGPIKGVSQVFVAAGATVSDSTLETFENAAGELKSTTYVVDGTEWMTVYDATGTYYVADVENAPVENAAFTGDWLNSDGVAVDDEKIGASKCTKVTADIEYDIYEIIITSCSGVQSIAIDGILVTGDDVVAAGTHKITCSIARGYEGTATVSLVKVDGDYTTASVSGDSVTVSGYAGTVYLQITGITASAEVVPTEKTDDGMKITDYLLIILVVLIAIMAIMVALRLMRS